MADVEFGFVYDFGAAEEFVARRGAGAKLDAGARPASPPGGGGSRSSASSRRSRSGRRPPLEALVGKAYRLRVVGSIAITAAYVAAGRFDAMLSLRPCRSVDIAAAQLIAREAGGAVASAPWRPLRGRPRPLLALPRRRRPRRGSAGDRPRRRGA